MYLCMCVRARACVGIYMLMPKRIILCVCVCSGDRVCMFAHLSLPFHVYLNVFIMFMCACVFMSPVSACLCVRV